MASNGPLNADELRELIDVDTPLTMARMDSLARALSIQWPRWYGELFDQLLRLPRPSELRDFWLPPGFLFSYARCIYSETMEFRAGRRLFGRVVTDGSGRSSDPAPWPQSYVAVGDVNAGDAIVIDTLSDSWTFIHIDRETGLARVLLDGSNFGKSPWELANAMVSWCSD